MYRHADDVKYVSGTYDTAIFEFKDTQVRDVLNHIQKERAKRKARRKLFLSIWKAKVCISLNRLLKLII